MSRYHTDASGEPRILARFRSLHYCRGCYSWKSPSSFTPTRILKRDYECRPCNTARRGRERGFFYVGRVRARAGPS